VHLYKFIGALIIHVLTGVYMLITGVRVSKRSAEGPGC